MAAALLQRNNLVQTQVAVRLLHLHETQVVPAVVQERLDELVSAIIVDIAIACPSCCSAVVS